MTRLPLLLGLALFLPLFLTLQADEPLPRGHYTLTGVEVTPIDRLRTPEGKIIDEKSDTLTHWIRFDVRPTFVKVEGSEQQAFLITNPIDSAKHSLTVDKPIRFRGKELAPGSNLMTFKKFGGAFFNVSMPGLNPHAIGSVHIREDFEFPVDDYSFTFRWETKDGQAFSKTIKVRIDLKR